MRFQRLLMLILLFVSVFTAFSGHIFIAWSLWLFIGAIAKNHSQCRQQWRYYRNLRNEYMRT